MMMGAINGDERRLPSGGEEELGRDEVLRGHQRSSEVIRGHQRSSEVISGHQRSSEVISGHQRSSEVLRGHQRSSEVALGRDALHCLGHCESFDRCGERIALREHMWRGMTKPIEPVLALRVVGPSSEHE